MPIKIGVSLSGEERDPNALIDQARRSEDDGFAFALLSDLRPWTEHQGRSPFVWSVLGPIARETRTLVVGTCVPCATIRLHPAMVAQAAATTAAMMPGRFFLGVGAGELANEPLIGEPGRPSGVRLSMLEESVRVLQSLWHGDTPAPGPGFRAVPDARLHDLSNTAPAIAVAASETEAAVLAARLADGLVAGAPERSVVDDFVLAGGAGPRYGQLTVCWARSDDEARRMADEVRANAATVRGLVGGLSSPALTSTERRRDGDVGAMVCGADPERHARAIAQYAEAGFDHVYVRQAGRDQDGFRRFYRDRVLPQVSRLECRVVA